MQAITRDQLRRKMERGDDFALVEVLPPDAYAKQHLPGAINLPLGESFDENARLTLPNKDVEVVVYCADEECSASSTAAEKLENLGYRRVLHYPKGKADWMQHGLNVVGPGEGP